MCPQGPLVTADIVGIAKELDRSLQAVSRAVGAALLLSTGISTPGWSALGLRLGKRPVYLLSTLFMFASSMIASYSKSFLRLPLHYELKNQSAKDYNMFLGGPLNYIPDSGLIPILIFKAHAY